MEQSCDTDVQCAQDAGAGGEIVDLGENEYVPCNQLKGNKKCSTGIEIRNVRRDQTESAEKYQRINVKSDVINIGESLSEDQQERIQGDQPRLIQGAQVTSHGDKIQGDRMCNSKPKEIRRYTPPTDNTKEPNHHSHPHSHTLTTAGENGLLQRDNTVLSTAPRGGKSTGPP